MTLSPGRLSGKVVVIGGGGGFGLGQACVRRFASEGASVICMDRRKDQAKAEDFRVRLADETGIEVGLCLVDPLDPATFSAALEGVVADTGALDVLVNLLVAGRTTDPTDWQWTLNSPFAPTYFGMRFAAELMSRLRGGSIINTSSVSGVVLSPSIKALPPLTDAERSQPLRMDAGSYGAAKSTVVFLTREFAVRYARRGIRVNVIAPGFMATPFTLDNIAGEYRATLEESIPMGHMGTPEDIAGTALFLATDDAKYITGQLITVDGGFSARSTV